MFTKKVLVAAMIAAGTLATAAAPLPSVAASNIEVYVNTPPPPPRHEAVPAPRHGYVWEPGHYEWSGHRHVWVAGHWLRARQGYAYRAPEWYERDGRWHYRPSRFDRDHDGIADNRDKDRDGDGVPNRYDRYPDNARYR